MNDRVRNHYESNPVQEWQRLDTPVSQLEFRSTLHLIEKYFPKNGHICDIGGGPGRYTIELLKQGYEVTLMDLSEALLTFAKSRLEEQDLHPKLIIHSDARDMSILESDAYDAVLLMGPMYHLPDAQDRQHVLSELRRILKPEGTAMVAYLNAWGVVRTGMTDFLDSYKDLSFVRSMMETFDLGIWHLSTPPEALEEINTSGLRIVTYAGVEGFAGGMKAILEQVAEEQPEVYTNIVRFAVETCELKQYRDATDHLHIVCRKPLGQVS